MTRSSSAALAAALVMTQLGACRGCGGPESTLSPDGRWRAQAFVKEDEGADHEHVFVEIRDSQGGLVLSQDSRASPVMRWSLEWASPDRLVLDSSDIGPVTWSLTSEGRWVADHELPEPAPLRRFVNPVCRPTNDDVIFRAPGGKTLRWTRTPTGTFAPAP